MFVIKSPPTNPVIRIRPNCLTFFDISAMVLAKIHQRFLKLFGATFFKPEKMAKSMESTRQKTFTQLRTLLSVAAVLVFIPLLCPALSAVGQCKVFRVTDGDTNKVKNNDNTSVIRLVGADAPETSEMNNVSVDPFCLNHTKNHPGLVLNKSVEKNCCGDDPYGRIPVVVYFNGTNIHFEMFKAGYAGVYGGRPP